MMFLKKKGYVFLGAEKKPKPFLKRRHSKFILEPLFAKFASYLESFFWFCCTSIEIKFKKIKKSPLKNSYLASKNK